MNILYIAHSCSPEHGSESKIGWNVPRVMAESNKVYVITREESRKSIDSYLSKYPTDNLKFYYVGVPDFYKKIFKGMFFSGQLKIWNRRAYKVAKKICDENGIQIIHQITPIEFRSVGNYMRIPDVRFVAGPLGGGEYIPKGLRDYAKGHMHVEMARRVLNYFCKITLTITHKLDKCDAVLFSNRETMAYLNEEGIIQSEIAEDLKKIAPSKIKKDTCVFIIAGRLIYRKGIRFLIDAIERIPESLNYRCMIVGDGPDAADLKKYCEGNKKIKDHVTFIGSMTYSEMEEKYSNADALIMPSIRETTGSVVLEAMSRGIPVITIKAFGGANIVDEQCGWLYTGIKKEDYIENLKNAMISCIKNPEMRIEKAQNSYKKAELYTWQEKVKRYTEIYEQLLIANKVKMNKPVKKD